MILLGVVGFFLFGQGNGAMLRTMGRYYGRAMRLKQDLLAEFTRAAELPTAVPGRPFTLRQALLGFDESGSPVASIVTSANPSPMAAPTAALQLPSGYLGPETWSMAVPTMPAEGALGR